MASSSRNADSHNGEIRLWREEGWWIAKDVDTGVTTQGETREVALANLDDAVQLFEDETGHAPTETELKAMGIDPAANTTGDQEPPDILE
ncbi:MAG: type II toxin-antitoxin system HicB family antitoxin [Halobacteriota archaeon]